MDFHSLSKACFLLAFDVGEADRVLQAETKEAGSSVETEVRFGENTVLSLQLPTAPDELLKLLHRS
ncbi:hypothetical protein N6H14_21540 [Paenibacillus sp. CC-CFT747]|nr:hypothetical protein N6H14_21540 [Paenibacillus sp. CC-CFT747]